VTLALIVPGSIDQRTGGYLFARRVVDGLARRGETIEVVELGGRFPDADATARAAAVAALARLGPGRSVIIDGLALAGFEPCLDLASGRKLVAWVHHPLALETGLSAAAQVRFAALEARLLPQFHGAICPSPATAAAVAAYGVAPGRIAVAPPGTAKPARMRSRGLVAGRAQMLTVATVTPRKGHRVLVEALARLQRADWEWHAIGSLARDPECVATLKRVIAAHSLDQRITLRDEMPPEELSAAYDAADLFVLPSFHEGYGMALAEALAHGLPVVSTRAGAIPDTVPESAGVLVEPGDVEALAAALERLLDDLAALARLADGARVAGEQLPDWGEAVTQWRREIARLVA
jgi:glycosyltransferase involved in cell wall biosynthesis